MKDLNNEGQALATLVWFAILYAISL